MENIIEPTSETAKAKIALHEYIKSGCNISATAKKINHKYNYTKKLLTEPFVKKIFLEILKRSGITDENLIAKIKEGLNATRYLERAGMEVPDYSVRHKYLQTALELAGYIKYDTKIETNNLNLVNINNIKQVFDNAFKEINNDRIKS